MPRGHWGLHPTFQGCPLCAFIRALWKHTHTIAQSLLLWWAPRSANCSTLCFLFAWLRSYRRARVVLYLNVVAICVAFLHGDRVISLFIRYSVFKQSCCLTPRKHVPQIFKLGSRELERRSLGNGHLRSFFFLDLSGLCRFLRDSRKLLQLFGNIRDFFNNPSLRWNWLIISARDRESRGTEAGVVYNVEEEN